MVAEIDRRAVSVPDQVRDRKEVAPIAERIGVKAEIGRQPDQRIGQRLRAEQEA
jgi:hypothetical protein